MIPANIDLSRLRATVHRLEEILAEARDRLALAELTLFMAKTEFCQCPLLEVPAPPEDSHDAN